MDGAIRVLLLVLALSHSWAAVTKDRCDQIKPNRLSADNLDKVSGDWVLALATFNQSPFSPNILRSVHLEFDLQPNASSMSFTERIMFFHGTCSMYKAQVNLTADAGRTFNSSFEEKGLVQPLNEVSQMVFYESCENCMVLEYKGLSGHVLFSARREGHHQNIENLSEAQSEHDQLADCLGMTGGQKYVYNATADLCPKTS